MWTEEFLEHKAEEVADEAVQRIGVGLASKYLKEIIKASILFGFQYIINNTQKETEK